MPWITMNGAHVFINEKGEVERGPANLLKESSSSTIQEMTNKYDPDFASIKGFDKAISSELKSTSNPWRTTNLVKLFGDKKQLSIAKKEYTKITKKIWKPYSDEASSVFSKDLE